MKKPANPEDLQLTLGSKYKILSLASRDDKIETRGLFKGVVSVGTIDAMAIELDESHGDLKGKLRVIPSHVILLIDVVEAASKEEKTKEEVNVHYG